MSRVTMAVEAIRAMIRRECEKMGPEEYMQVCEEIAADMDGNIDALKDENPDLFA